MFDGVAVGCGTRGGVLGAAPVGPATSAETAPMSLAERLELLSNE